MSQVINYDALIRAFIEDPKFVPRKWLTEEVEHSVGAASGGFVLLTAESGAGKTGLSAALAHSHPDWLRYFIRRDSQTPLSSGDAISFLFSIGNQLALQRPKLFHPDKLEVIVKQRIGELKPGGRAVGLMVEDLYVSPFYRTAVEVDSEASIVGGDLAGLVVKRMVAEKRFLEIENLQYLALFDPAAILQQEDPGARIVILIDALDEIRPSAGEGSLLDWLASCPELPPNIKFVLTSRNDADLRLFRATKSSVIQELTIDPNRDEVRSDMEGYLDLFTLQPAASQALQRNSIEARKFVREARTRARGNFGYASTLTRGILEAEARGEWELVSELLRLERVPERLGNLYTFFLSKLRDRMQKLGMLEVSKPVNPHDRAVPAWEGVAQRALGVLAVAREPLSIEQITRLGGIRAWPRDVGNVLGQMLEFLGTDNSRYRLFHSSFADYLTHPETSQTAPDYYFDPLEWHTRIVRSYQDDAIDGVNVNWSSFDDYGLLYLADHLASGDADMRREISKLVQPAARHAMLDRFLTDAAFLHLVNVASSEAIASADTASSLPQLVYLSAVKALLSMAGDHMTPPVLGLMTKLGRIATALGYIDTMNATKSRYYGLKAIRNNATPAELTRAGEMASLDRLETFALSLPETNYRYAFNSQRAEVMIDFAKVIAPVNLNRAMQIAAPQSAQDAVLKSAAMAKDTPEEALELIRRMDNDRAEAALDCLDRLLPHAGEQCRSLLEDAEAHIDLTALTEKTAPLAGRLIHAWSRIDTGHATELWHTVLPVLCAAASGERPLEGEGYSKLWFLVSIARDLWDFDTPTICSLLTNAFAGTPDSLNVYAFLEVAGLWASKGDAAQARDIVDRTLPVSREHAPHATARDLVRAAEAITPADPAFAQKLVDEALTLLNEEQQPVSARNDSTWEAIALGLSRRDVDAALRAARRVESMSWAPQPGEIIGSDRTSVLVQLALERLPSDRAGAESLLEECLCALTGIEKVAAAEAPFQSGIDLDAANLKALPQYTMVMQITYYTNALNHGMERRNWRIFETPIELLYDLLAPPHLNGSPYFVERTLRRFAEAAAPVEPQIAADLCASIKNDTERAIAYAALFNALSQTDWDQAVQFAGAALDISETIDATASSSLPDQFEILRWTNGRIRNLMEIAMHLGRYHPPSMQQIIGRIDSQVMTAYVSCEMISRTVEDESRGMLKAGTPLEQVNRFHLSVMSLLSLPMDSIPAWIMAQYVLRTMAQYDIDKARQQVARFPVDTLGALVRIRAASGAAATDKNIAVSWLHEAAESLASDASPAHRASILGRAAAGLTGLDRSQAVTWAETALDLARGITNPLIRGYAMLDLLRQPELHSLLQLQILVDEVDHCLINAGSPDIQAELATRSVPVLLEFAPRLGLRRFFEISSTHWVTLLALLDHAAEAITKVCGAPALITIADAVDAAMAYMEQPTLPRQSGSHTTA